MKSLTSAEIRESFLKFFEERGHRRVASSSLIPGDDPTLLFTNAGMNQFKDVFTGREKREYTRAASSQKCVRAGGKHNDLENVGFTARHHTFFEMLGNFSFGDYFKKDAIDYAWKLVVDVWGLPVERLWFTVYTDDDEALELWKQVGARPDRILRFGEKDNFWAMGETGPCGPCSEIHFYRPDDLSGNVPELVNGPGDETMEIWNLVFMQFERSADGTKAPLPKPSVDTGAGLERVTSVLQGVPSNYDSDLFAPILRRIGEISGAVYGVDAATSAAMRVVADHGRAATFLVADGVRPSNEGRGYVLRRIVRRALRYGRKLGLGEGGAIFLPKVVDAVALSLGEFYPEIEREKKNVEEILRQEETTFSRTMTRAFDATLDAAAAVSARGSSVIDGKTAFDLYQTWGAPLDLVEEIARERGIGVDVSGFEAALEEERTRAKASWKGDDGLDAKLFEGALAGGEIRFVGYDSIEAKGEKVVALFSGGQRVGRLPAGATGELVVAATPFYPEGGGQVGDSGWWNGPSGAGEVRETRKPLPGLIVHRIQVGNGEIREGEPVDLLVDGLRRAATTRNHTGTHLLHAALREVLGTTVRQAGSFVSPDRLRFDYTASEAPSAALLVRIEEIVNRHVLENRQVSKEVMGMEEAKGRGALMFFGEKYGDRVRVVSVPGFSTELCGGCHVRATGDIGLLKIVSDRALAAGVRRIEAVTGLGALELFQRVDGLLDGLSRELNVPPEDLPKSLGSLRERSRELEKEVASMRVKLAAGGGGGAGDGMTIDDVGGIRIHVRKVENIAGGDLRNLADTLRGKIGSGLVVIGALGEDGKVTLLAAATADVATKVPASKVIQRISPIVGGKGGGKADLAQGGGNDPSKLAEALAAVRGVVADLAG
jgi:alanyl-tRNA synthetase